MLKDGQISANFKDTVPCLLYRPQSLDIPLAVSWQIREIRGIFDGLYQFQHSNLCNQMGRLSRQISLTTEMLQLVVNSEMKCYSVLSANRLIWVQRIIFL